MEGRAHSRETYKTAGQVSWMEQDLLDCSENFKASFKLRPEDKRYNTLARDENEKLHVCVIGAGLAGLRCAEVLIEKGVQVTILEARDRLGGRVHQTDLLGHAVDMGPNWIHGTLTNPIINLAKETGTALCLIEDSPLVFDQNGRLIGTEKADNHMEMVWSIISDAFKYSIEDCSKISPKRSLRDFFGEKVRETGLSEDDQTLILHMAEMWGAFIGDPLEKQSLKYFWLEECLDGENLFVASNHGQIIQRVAESALRSAEILFNTRAVQIASAGTKGHPTVIVRTDAQEMEFDEVVVTVPLGCLKRQTPTFSPPLVPAITRGIQNTSYSRLEKVYVSFPTAFWESAIESSETAETRKETRFQSFAHFLHPTYSSSNPDSWSLELNSLSSPSLFGTNARPTLLFCLYGPCATHITTLINHLSPTSPEYFTLLDTFFRPYYSLLPSFSITSASCRPNAYLATNWQNDALAGFGSYMNFQNREEPLEGEEEVKLEEDIRTMRWGMPERGVWLAGEHTAPFVALGTLTGAYWSGEGVGCRILRLHGKMGEGEEEGKSR